MQLCLECGRVEEHREECPRRPPTPGTPVEKQKRVQKAMAVAQAVLDATDEMEKTSPKLAILKLLAGEAVLDRYPSRDLAAFDQKRAHNDLGTALAKKRAALEQSSGAGARFTEDARFAKQAVEALFAQALRREEAKRFDLTGLEKLPVKPLANLKAPLKKISEEIGERLDQSRSVDAKVTEWGWKNLGRLMLGLDPLEVPPKMLGGAGLFGKGAKAQEVAQTFKPLGDQFRERLYLIGANAALLPVISRQAQTEEAWRKLIAKAGNAERWERIKAGEKELLEYLVGAEPSLPQGVEEVIVLLAVNSRALESLGLRPASEVRGVEWEGWAKGYFLELAAITEGEMKTFEFSTRKLSKLLIERRNREEIPRERVASVLARLQEAWRAEPPPDTSQS
jgi:hypothetical protein